MKVMKFSLFGLHICLILQSTGTNYGNPVYGIRYRTLIKVLSCLFAVMSSGKIIANGSTQ